MSKIKAGQDLIRVGTYAQLEGNFIKSGNRNNYRFRFYSNQIEDMRELLSRVMKDDELGKGVIISISSQDLYNKLVQLGFYRFNVTDWNVPKVASFGLDGRTEYLRAIIDAIGNVDIANGSSPYVQLSSVNEDGLKAIQSIYGGYIRGPYTDSPSLFLQWSGKEALAILETVDWKFYNRRNQRGAELIKAVKWGDYLI